MKKATFTFALAMLCVFVVNAQQDFTSKKGIPILPEKGDYSISIDAVPFFQNLGNMFHGNDATPAPTFDFPGLGDVPMWTIQVKKFTSPTSAYRARLKIGFTNNTLKNTLADQNNTSTTPAFVDDKWTESQMNIVLGLGMEKRRGKGRVQGFYGAMANLMVNTHANKLVYGNAMDATHTDPLSTDYPWVAAIDGGYETSNIDNRVTKDVKGLGLGIGANVFLGVEYFFAPKMSIGGEFSFGLLFSITGKSKTQAESWDATAGGVKTTTYKYGGSTFFGIDNSNSGGAINLNFYF